MEHSVVAMAGVGKTYPRGRQEVRVLDAVSMKVREGEFVALMGPSGCGKTTLLNLMGGLDRPSSGSILVAGERLDAASPRSLARWRAQNVGFVFQFHHLLRGLTAEQNVELPLLLTRLGRAERRAHVREALELVGLEGRAAHKPSELSGGQEQRVGIARAIVSDPALLLCDEPTGDLDRRSSEEILDLLSALHRQEGKTIVMVTHDPRAAERADRTLMLEEGSMRGAVS